MLTVNSMVPPSADQFDLVFKGMRLPMKSGHLSDSKVAQVVGKQFTAGQKDLGLALNLIKAGASDRKFLRQLPIIMEVTADQIFFRQCDQYKVGTVTNSSSQMHRLHKTQFTLDDFNIPDLDKHTPDVMDTVKFYIEQINMFIRQANSKKEDGDPEWKKDWDFALSMVPQSVYYTKCWSLNYETAINIGLQREGHKNGAWDELINYWKENLPYYKEFLEAAKHKQKKMERLTNENEMLWKTVEAFEFEKQEGDNSNSYTYKELEKKLKGLDACFDKLLNWNLEVLSGTRQIKKERDSLILSLDKFKKENEELRKRLDD